MCCDTELQLLNRGQLTSEQLLKQFKKVINLSISRVFDHQPDLNFPTPRLVLVSVSLQVSTHAIFLQLQCDLHWNAPHIHHEIFCFAFLGIEADKIDGLWILDAPKLISFSSLQQCLNSEPMLLYQVCLIFLNCILLFITSHVLKYNPCLVIVYLTSDHATKIVFESIPDTLTVAFSYWYELVPVGPCLSLIL